MFILYSLFLVNLQPKSTHNMKTIFLTIIIPLLFLTSCSVEPQPIDYGNDHCHFCDMTVVDHSHAAEYTTKKGKSYMFDAVECLVRQLNQENNEDKMAFVLVADYANPGNLIDAKTATYLISPKIKSPMGANLSAFSDKKVAEQTQQEFGGELYTWEEIKTKLQK